MGNHKWIHRYLKHLADAETTAAEYRKLPEVESAKVVREINGKLKIDVTYKPRATDFPRLK